MKKMLMVLLGLALVLSMTGMVAAADEEPMDGGDGVAPTDDSGATTTTTESADQDDPEKDVYVVYTLQQTYNVILPSGSGSGTQAINEVEFTDYVNVTRLQLTAGNKLTIDVMSNNGYKMTLGTDSAIPWKLFISDEIGWYTKNIDRPTEYHPVGEVEAGTEFDESINSYLKMGLKFQTTLDWIAEAKYAGEHKDTLTFLLDVKESLTP